MGGAFAGHSSVPVSLVSYNCNSLLCNLSLVCSLPASIIVLQETRLTELQYKTALAQCAQGFALFSGPFAATARTGRYFAVDKKHPGTAFLVADTLSAVPYCFPPLLEAWIARGFLNGIEVFIGGRWILFCSIYVPLTPEGPPFLQDLVTFVENPGRMDVVIAGDFNREPSGSVFTRAACHAGFRSLASEEAFDFITYRTKGRSQGLATSCIDDIFVSPALAEVVEPLTGCWPRPYGHKAISTAF